MSTPFPAVPDAKLLEVYHNDPMVNSCVRMGVPMEGIIVYMAKRHKDVLEEMLKKDLKTCPSYTYIEIHSKPTA